MLRLLLGLSGLTGAAGVIVFALAAHAAPLGSPERSALNSAAIMMLAHGGAGFALAALSSRTQSGWRWALIGLVLVIGAGLFGGAVATPLLLGVPSIPMAAPLGGSLTILAWLLAALNGLFATEARSRDDD